MKLPTPVVLSALGVLLFPVVVLAQGPPPAADQGPIKIEILATRGELGQITSVSQRMNAKLGQDAKFVQELTAAVAEERYEAAAELVARTAGVGKGAVKAGPGGNPTALRGGEVGSVLHPALSTTAVESGPAAPTERNPWYIMYRGESWTICIGTCPVTAMAGNPADAGVISAAATGLQAGTD